MHIEVNVSYDQRSFALYIDSDKTVRDLRREIGKIGGPLLYDSRLIVSGVELKDDDQILEEAIPRPELNVILRDTFHRRLLQKEGVIYDDFYTNEIFPSTRQYPIIISYVTSLQREGLREIKQLAQDLLPENVLNRTTYVDIKLIESKEGHFSLVYLFHLNYERGVIGSLVQEFPFPVAQISEEIKETGKSYYLILGMDGGLSKLSFLNETGFEIPDSLTEPISTTLYPLPFRISRIGVITPYFIVLYDTRMNLVLMMRNRITRDPEFRFLSLEKELPIPQGDLNNYERVLSSEEGDFYVISDRGPVQEVNRKFVLDSHSTLYYEGEFVAERLKDFEVIRHSHYYDSEYAAILAIDEEDNLWKGEGEGTREKKWTVESFKKIGKGYSFRNPPKVESGFSFVKSARS